VAEQGGVLQQVLGVNAECEIGAVIGRLFSTEQERREYLAAAERVHASGPQAGDVVVTTSAREAAVELGIDLAELRALGKKVLKRRDVEEFAAARTPEPMVAEGPADGGGVRLSAAQRAVAQVVTRSHQSVPAAFAVIKVPVDAALGLQSELAARSQGVIGLPELLIKTVAGLRERFPLFFGSFRENGTVALFDGAHVGVTLDLGKGLYIPVIKHAETKSLAEIADGLMDLRVSALRGSFRASELVGGNITISLSNDAGIVLARPIIFSDQACMVCLCATQEEVYRTGEAEFGVRRYAQVGITYDHRVVNGRDAVAFLQELASVFADQDELRRLASESVDRS
jgi:2-oxoglutarate dehydrogenase E2 component (dihydrolipoamide succinyltransferase)